MKFAIVLLVACLAAVYSQQTGSPAAAGQASMLALGGAPQQAGGGMDFLSFGALSGTMGDSMRDLYLCRMWNINPILCLSGGMM